MTREQVEAMLNAATPGPWKSDDLDRVVAPYVCINGLSALFEIAWISIPHDSERGYTDDAFNPDVAAANLVLIAAAPDLASALLAAWDERDALQAEVDRLKGALRDARNLSQTANSDDVYAHCNAALVKP